MIRSRNTKTLGATTRALMEADFVLLTALTKGDRRLILAFERAFPAAVLCAFDEAQLAELAGAAPRCRGESGARKPGAVAHAAHCVARDAVGVAGGPGH